MVTPTLVTVTGHVEATAGTVTFTQHRPLISAVDDSVVPPPASPTVATIDASGNFTVQLYATNDPDWLPVGWAYSVRVNAGGGARGSMLLDYATPAVDFDDVFQPSISADTGRQYLARTELGAPGGAASLGETGKLSADQRPTAADLGIYAGPTEPVGAADGSIWFDTSGA